jgi:hypothetical protein
VLLNPADYIFPSKEKYHVEGFVIAKNKAQSDLSGGLSHGSGEGSSMGSNSTPVASTIAIRRQSVAILSGGKKPPLPSNPVVMEKKSGWQALMSNQQPSGEELSNQQEHLQKLEDQHLKKNFYVREVPLSLEEATVSTSVLEEYPLMESHVVIIGKGVSNLFDLIRPLRAKYLGKLRHIVILHPVEIPLSIWRRISIFEGILFVRGSALEESDLRRTGIFRASQVVVLAAATMEMDLSKSNSSALVDAEAVFCYHSVKRLNDKASVVVEIVREQNVSYLNVNSMSVTDEGYKFSPQFASGSLFTSSMLDTIVCQVYSYSIEVSISAHLHNFPYYRHFIILKS